LDGAILDGRHRYRACCELGIEPSSRSFLSGDPIKFVIDANLKRRHLNASQRGMAMAQFAKFRPGGSDSQRAELIEKAKEGGNGQNCPLLSNREAAQAAGVGTRTIKDARVVLNEGSDEDIAAVRAGKAGVDKIAKRLRKVPGRSSNQTTQGTFSLPKRRSPDARRTNRERTQAQRQNAADYCRLRDALNNLTSLARPSDAVDIILKIAKGPPIINAKLDSALTWLREFTNEWHAKYRTASPASRRDRPRHSRHGARSLGA
jgi:hypothetical protein